MCYVLLWPCEQGAFLAEGIEYNQKEVTPKIKAYEHYKEYCDVIGITPKSNSSKI